MKYSSKSRDIPLLSQTISESLKPFYENLNRKIHCPTATTTTTNGNFKTNLQKLLVTKQKRGVCYAIPYLH